jgi:hypothetical protein
MPKPGCSDPGFGYHEKFAFVVGRRDLTLLPVARTTYRESVLGVEFGAMIYIAPLGRK